MGSNGTESSNQEVDLPAPPYFITYQNDVRQLSPLARETLDRVHQKRRRSIIKEGTTFAIRDNTFSGYGWLLPGWLAEERHMKSGRIYRYYYDPYGHMYQNQHEVLNAFEDHGVIVLDK